MAAAPSSCRSGRLSNPGVETKPHNSTGVARVDLDEFCERRLAHLVGHATFEKIDARAILGQGDVPLRDKEAELRREMLEVERTEAPLGCYLRHPTARLNRRMTTTRKFRRSTTRDLLYFRDGEDLGYTTWMLDLAPGTRDSRPRRAKTGDADREMHLVFRNLDELAWQSQLAEDEAPTRSRIQSLTEVLVPEYGGPSDQPEPVVTYGEWTGFTRGRPEDLWMPFGKGPRDQHVA